MLGAPILCLGTRTMNETEIEELRRDLIDAIQSSFWLIEVEAKDELAEECANVVLQYLYDNGNLTE